jgi:hypothetical protein
MTSLRRLNSIADHGGSLLEDGLNSFATLCDLIADRCPDIRVAGGGMGDVCRIRFEGVPTRCPTSTNFRSITIPFRLPFCPPPHGA